MQIRMFTDENSVIDREALRTYTLAQLKQLHTEAVQLVNSSQAQFSWHKIHNYLVSHIDEPEKNAYLDVLREIYQLPKYIKRWIHMAVDSPQRFEFFISAKAEEVKSGDMDHDYFWALQIRHDQLIAVVRVIGRYTDTLKHWLDQRPQQVIEDPIFQGLIDHNLESQIYLEAEHIQKERNQHLQN